MCKASNQQSCQPNIYITGRRAFRERKIVYSRLGSREERYRNCHLSFLLPQQSTSHQQNKISLEGNHRSWHWKDLTPWGAWRWWGWSTYELLDWGCFWKLESLWTAGTFQVSDYYICTSSFCGVGGQFCLHDKGASRKLKLQWLGPSKRVEAGCLGVASRGFPGWLDGKEPSCRCKRHRFNPWEGKIPWRRKWQPTPVFLPGKPHGQRSLVTPWGPKELDMT